MVKVAENHTWKRNKLNMNISCVRMYAGDAMDVICCEEQDEDIAREGEVGE